MIQRSAAAQRNTVLRIANWLWLGGALLILALNFLVIAYRHTLPSDGWDVGLFVLEGKRQIIFNQNLLGAPSPLQPGDALVAVDGQPVEQLWSQALTLRNARPPDWKAGNTARYTVLRNGQVQTLHVPLYHRGADFLPRVFANDPFRNVGMVGMLLLGLFVWVRRPHDRASRLLLMFSVCLTAYLTSVQVSGERGGPAELLDRWAYWPTELLNTFIWPLALNPLFPHVFLLFPVVKRPMRQHPWPVLSVLYGLPALLLLLGLWNLHERPLIYWSFFYLIIALQIPLGLLTVGLCVWHSLRNEHNAVAQAQIRWMALGFVGMGLAGALFLLTRLFFGDQPVLTALVTLGGLLLPLSLAIAILRYRLFAIDMVINRALVYGVLSSVLTLVYIGSVVLLQYVVYTFTGQAQSDLVVIGSTLAIAGLFQPLRRRIQAFIDSTLR